jgi:hypothetical protein
MHGPLMLTRSPTTVQENPELGLVQARWSFVNKDENLLTRLQNINLCFHFEVEQQVNGVYLNFFGFNGTAGVWRIKALEDSGGWMERTTVEDMDIAVRAHLNGWKFIFLNDVKVCLAHIQQVARYRVSWTCDPTKHDMCICRSSASCRSLTRLTGSSSTGGTPAPCSSSASASRPSLGPR